MWKVGAPLSSQRVNAVPGPQQIMNESIANKTSGARDRDVHGKHAFDGTFSWAAD